MVGSLHWKGTLTDRVGRPHHDPAPPNGYTTEGDAHEPPHTRARPITTTSRTRQLDSSALEYYDFAVYGTAAAIVLNRIFFPEDTAAIGILKSMVVVGVAYIVRPFGAMIVGPLGDRYGRRFVLMLTLFLMGSATFSIGCLPTYSQAGILAPILLVACRMLQGLSAAGEQASSISISLEHAHEHQRAFTTSWTLQGTQFGSLLATAVFIPFAALPDEHLLTWGWRVPFWLSAFVVVTAWLIRRTLSEPPAYLQREKLTESPLMLVFKHHKRAVLTIAVCAMVNTVNMVFTTFALSFATKGYGLDRSTMLLVPVASNTLGLIAIPLAAMLADRIGRKPVFMTGAVASSLVMFPYLGAITEGNWVGIFTYGVLMHGALYSMANGVWPAFYAEMFPTRVRVTGLALVPRLASQFLEASPPPWRPASPVLTCTMRRCPPCSRSPCACSWQWAR